MTFLDKHPLAFQYF